MIDRSPLHEMSKGDSDVAIGTLAKYRNVGLACIVRRLTDISAMAEISANGLSGHLADRL